jgi:hypothetical protein
MMMMPALMIAPPQSSQAGVLDVTTTAHASWSQATVSMNTPNSQYSWKCSPATAK